MTATEPENDGDGDGDADQPVVTVVGSYNVGLTMTVPRFPVPGETVVGENFAEGPGGKGANQAVGAARLGAAARFVGRVGEDRYGDRALELFEAEGVGAGAVVRDPEAATGAGFVVVREDGENEITVAPGANDRLDADDVAAAADRIAGGDDLRQADVLLVGLEVPDDPVIAAVEHAVDAGVPVVCNPAPARELPAAILEGTRVLTPNRSEANVLAGREPDADTDPEAVARGLLAMGPESVVVTLGAEGAVVVENGAVTRVTAPDVEAVDTTGAGDAFNAAFAVALAGGADPVGAARVGCRAGALATTTPEVIPALPRRADMEGL
jgi:ribokinase